MKETNGLKDIPTKDLVRELLIRDKRIDENGCIQKVKLYYGQVDDSPKEGSFWLDPDNPFIVSHFYKGEWRTYEEPIPYQFGYEITNILYEVEKEFEELIKNNEV